MIVFPGRHADWQDPKTAGHTQMNHQGAVAKDQQEILRPASDFKDFFAANPSRQTMSYRPAEFQLSNVNRLNDHVDLVLTNRRVLRFHDPRRFGSVLWVRGDPLRSPQLAHLGPEPFDEAFCGRMLFTAARGRRAAVKNFIMDGRIVVGVGNIYANEALFRSGILPGRSAGRVALHRYQGLVAAIQEVLTEAIEAGGTTLRDYAQVTGEPGYFEQALQVYKRAGEPCVNCNSVIRRKMIGQRASYYCANCQR